MEAVSTVRTSARIFISYEFIADASQTRNAMEMDVLRTAALPQNEQWHVRFTENWIERDLVRSFFLIRHKS